jgi:hypothetical protein
MARRWCPCRRIEGRRYLTHLPPLWERCELTRPWIDVRSELALKVAIDPGGLLVADLGAPKVNLQVRRANAEVVAFYQSLGYVDDDVTSLGRRLD